MMKIEFAFDDFFDNTRIIMDSHVLGDNVNVDSDDIGRMDIVSIWLLSADAKEC